jgi:hypothetical protein
LLVALAQRQRLGGLDETAGAVRVFLDIHALLPRPVRTAPQARLKTSSLGFCCAFHDLHQEHAAEPVGRPTFPM